MTRRNPITPVLAKPAIRLTWPKGPLPTLAQAEAALILLAVEQSSSQAEAARRLGISAKQLRARLRRLAPSTSRGTRPRRGTYASIWYP